MKQIILISIFFLASGAVFGQNLKIDKLEMLFTQGHYKRVHRKANRLLDDPAYDYSVMPKYYKSLALIELSQNEVWLKNHKTALLDAKELFNIVKQSEDAAKLFEAHMYELSSVKQDMISWAADLKRRGLDQEFRTVQELIDVLFEGINSIEGNDVIVEVYVDSSNANSLNLEYRDEIVLTAKQQLGTPYVWAGSSPDGFDCSGFTSYVMKENGKSLPRRAADQYSDARKVKAKDVREGDLVFFDNGSGISHVGIVISKNGEPLQMIHSSSSKGIIITDVSQSEYWTKRLYGFATYVD